LAPSRSTTVSPRRRTSSPSSPTRGRTWTNLFPTCNTHRCNERRKKKYPEGGLLDPAGGDGIERRLRQRIVGLVSLVLAIDDDMRLAFEAVERSDIAACNTAEELDRIHNGTDSSSEDTARALRRAIRTEVAKVAKIVMRHERLSQTPSASEAERAALIDKLRKLTSRHAPFTMLVRSYFARNALVSSLFD
jgi:hypothetical protein